MSTFASRFRQAGLHRPRLLVAAAAGFASFFFLPEAWTFAARVLVAWNIGVWPYLAAIVWLMLRTTSEGVRGIAMQEDASSAGLLVLMCTAAVLSLVAIMAELAHGRDAGETAPFVYGITLSTVAGSWFLVERPAMAFKRRLGTRTPRAAPDLVSGSMQGQGLSSRTE